MPPEPNERRERRRNARAKRQDQRQGRALDDQPPAPQVREIGLHLERLFRIDAHQPQGLGGDGDAGGLGDRLDCNQIGASSCAR
jgi:hypothetical protein